MGFDMTQVKVGDKLLTRDGRVVTVVEIDADFGRSVPYRLSNDLWYFPNGTWDNSSNGDAYSIVGFADEQSRTSEVVPEPENKGVKSDQREHNHYFKDVRHLDFIDVYRVIDLWELKDPALQHALKKLLVPGNRGHKDIQKDVQDVIDSCKRWQEMQAENGTKE